MKRMILGIAWQAIGFLGAIMILCQAATQDWDYNGITGLPGSLLGTGLMIPLVVCVLLFIAGIALSIVEIHKGNAD